MKNANENQNGVTGVDHTNGYHLNATNTMNEMQELWEKAKPISELDLDGLARAFDEVSKECWHCDALIPKSRQKASGLCAKCLPEDTIEILSDNAEVSHDAKRRCDH